MSARGDRRQPRVALPLLEGRVYREVHVLRRQGHRSLSRRYSRSARSCASSS
ncbi:hypothetical protein PF003_g36356 [Phytophthora fragariae]|nr:hypothetical protein PF003_g36356 [Phytophthora fragariae]